MDAHRRLGPYEILALHGEGGMGAVYRARHRELGRQVALKVLRPECALDHLTLARFRREAQVAAALSHPALVEVYDFGRDNEMDYIAMEWVEGRTLKEVIEAGALPLAQALELGVAALEGLAACHAAGVLHRDLKPANLMLDAAGHLRILDFGLGSQVGRTVLTRPGEVMGTPRYMPPEVLLQLGHDAGSDLYQLGLVIYECVLGRPVYNRKLIEGLVASILTDPLPPLPDPGRSGVAQGVLERLAARDREARYPDAKAALAAMKLALQRLGAGGARRARNAPDARGNEALAPAPASAAPRARAPSAANAARSANATSAASAARVRARLVPAAAVIAALALGAAALFAPRRAPPSPRSAAVAPSASARPERRTGRELAIAATRWLSEIVHPRRFRQIVRGNRLAPLAGQAAGAALLAEVARLRATIDTPAYRALRAELAASADRVESSDEPSPEERSALLRRAADFEDLHVMLTEELRVVPGWEPLPVPGLAPTGADVSGAETFFALDFAPGHKDRPGVSALGPPGVFLEESESTLQMGTRGSRDDVVAGPVRLPAGARRVYLSYRLSGGRRDERLVAHMAPAGKTLKSGELAVLRGAGHDAVREGVLGVDRRLFESGLVLGLRAIYGGPDGAAEGIRLERFELKFMRTGYLRE